MTAYQKICHIDFLDSMKSLKSFTLYALHPNSPLSLQSVAKNIETHYIFTEKSLKMLIDQRYSEFPFQVRKSYVKHWQPEMTKQTCNQH